jgi:hypothetical protein
MALSRITAASIADGTVVAADIADGAVTGPKLGATSINANNIVDSSITSGKIDTIANTQLTGTITTAQLGTGAVSNTKIASGAVEQYFADTGYEAQFRNRIINGDMRIDQRNAGANVTFTGAYTLDRFYCAEDTDGTISAQQVTDGPTGFTNSMKFTVGTADASLGAAQYVYFRQGIEGFNFADCEFGTANAKTVTVSFWVKSNITGTFGGNIASTGHDRSYAFAYTINSANTWEYKTATIPGDTSGTWNKTNSVGAWLHFCLASGATYLQSTGSWAAGTYLGPTGQTNLMATTANTFNITGVQLEVGSVATPFERRPFGTEFMLCQRYFQRNVLNDYDYPFSSGYAYANNTVAGYLPLAVAMRAIPTATIVGNMGVRGGGLGNQTLSSLGSIGYATGAAVVSCNPTTSATNLVTSTIYIIANFNGAGGFTLSAEL